MALSLDLPPGLAMPARCGALELAVWRGASGAVAAWIDRCPHRGMRLSHGFVRGDWLSCLYHGWRYDGEGRCRKIPAHPDLDPPATIRAAPVPCAEAGGVVWVAPEAPGGPPPGLDGLVPLRSLALEVGAEALDGEADGSRLRLPPEGASPALVLLLQPLGEGRTAVHALAEGGGDAAALVAASRRLESWRREAEAEDEA